MSIFRTALRANDTRSKIALESEQEQQEEQVQVEQVIPAGDSNVTGTDTETPAGLTEGEVQGVEVPGEALDVTNLLEAEAQDVQDKAEELVVDEEVTSVAMEAIQNKLQQCLRAGFALEQLSEQLQATVEGEGEGITPQVAQMVITANDALSGSNDVITKEDDSADPTDTGEVAGVAESGGEAEGGEVFGQGIPALESFIYSSRIATEALAEEAANKSEGFFKTVADTVTRVARGIKDRVQSYVDFYKNTHLVLIKYLEESEKLAAVKGQKLDEARQQRLRAMLDLSGNGTDAVVQALSKELPAVVDLADDAIELTAKLAQSLKVNDPESVEREARRFTQQVVNRIKNSGVIWDLSVSAVGFSNLRELSTIKPEEIFKVNFEMKSASATQEYTVLTEQQLQKLVRATRDVSNRLEGFHREFSANFSSLGDGFFTRLKKQYDSDAEKREEMKIARRAYANLMIAANRMCSDLSHALIAHGSVLGNHSLAIARASFSHAKAAKATAA